MLLVGYVWNLYSLCYCSLIAKRNLNCVVGDDTGRVWEGAGREKEGPAGSKNWSKKGGHQGICIHAATVKQERKWWDLY